MFQIDASWFQFQIEPWLIVLVIVAIIAFLIIVIIWGIRAHRRRVSAGREELVGRIAKVKTVLSPLGTVLVEGELWTAVLDEDQALPGDEVVITKVDGLKLQVTKSKPVNM